MKRGRIRSSKIYVGENGKKLIKYAVQVKIGISKIWTQARKDDFQLIFDTKEEADQVVIDYIDEKKKTIVERINEGKVKVNLPKQKKGK